MNGYSAYHVLAHLLEGEGQTHAAKLPKNLIAMNPLHPKIVGSRVHLNPLAVTVALMVWGSFWDAAR